MLFVSKLNRAGSALCYPRLTSVGNPTTTGAGIAGLIGRAVFNHR